MLQSTCRTTIIASLPTLSVESREVGYMFAGHDTATLLNQGNKPAK